jgi:hypothetical protein
MVADDFTDPFSSLQPFMTEDGTLHSVSTSAATEPPVSSITVYENSLEWWVRNWVEAHEPHADDDECWATLEPGESIDDANIGFDEVPMKLITCCDELKPVPPPPFLVNASQSFVTVYDYVSQVHSWFQTVEPQIEEARDVLSCLGGKPANIYFASMDSLFLVTGWDGETDFESEWKQQADMARKMIDGTHPLMVR